ncbi:hypothetical protein ACK32R_03875 [Aeromonas dhakensis]|uniref:hypothetical protein n=1 Tax=Aeromonas dhakensis TaxID=196024 RepID=UPI003985B992
MQFAQQNVDVYMSAVESFMYSSSDVHRLLWGDELAECLWDARSKLFVESYLVEAMKGLISPISASMAVKIFAALNNPAISTASFNKCIEILQLNFDSRANIIKLASSKKHLISGDVVRLVYERFPELSDFVAECPNASIDILDRIICSDSPHLESLALNTNIPPSIRSNLIRIAFDSIRKTSYTSFYNVMVRLAQCSMLDEVEIERIFDCQDARVCVQLLSQPQLPQKIVEAISGNPQGFWFESKDCFIDDDFILLDHFQLEWLKTGFLTYEQQIKFASGSRLQQVALASNKNLSADAIERLSMSTSMDVQQTLCEHVAFDKYMDELSINVAHNINSACLANLLKNKSFKHPEAWLIIYNRFLDSMRVTDLSHCLRGINSSPIIESVVNSRQLDALLELSINPWLNAEQIINLLQSVGDLRESCESSFLVEIIRNISKSPHHSIISVGNLISFYAEIKGVLDIETNVSKDIFNAATRLLRKVVCPGYFGYISESHRDGAHFYCELNRLVHLILDHTSDELLISKSPFYHIVVALVDHENSFYCADEKGMGILCKIQRICPSVGEMLLNRALTLKQEKLSQEFSVVLRKNRREL